MSLQVITLTNAPNQSYTVNLNVDGSPLALNITVSFNEMAGYWVLSIFNASSQLLLASVPMLTGYYPASNLLQQQRYLNIGSWYLINVSNLSTDVGGDTGYGQGGYGQGPYGGEQGQGGSDYPNSTNLGTDFQLWVDDTPTV